MAYANIDDVVAILPDEEEEIPSEAEDRVVVTLEEATDLVISYLGREYSGDADDDGVPDDVPGAVRRVVARVALRGYLDTPSNPGAEAETHLMGPMSWSVNWSKLAQARDLYLTDSDKERLKRFQLSTPRGVYHAPMVGSGGHGWPWYA